MSSGTAGFDCSLKGLIAGIKKFVKVVKAMTHSDVSSNLANLLPTGTFLTFQAIAPIFTNNGSCHNAEKVVTGILVAIFGLICIILTYSDSLTTPAGKLYYGIVTRSGLYNPQFKHSSITGVTGAFYTADRKYFVTIFDTINAVFSVTVFGTLSLLTPPVSTCFFPHIPNVITKSVPVLVGIVVGFYFSFAPTPRRGVGFAITGLTSSSDEHKTDVEAGTQSGTELQEPKTKTVSDDTPVQRSGTTVPTQRTGTTVKTIDTSP